MTTIEGIKERLSIPEAWQMLGYEVPTHWKQCSSPWRQDKKPSFSVFSDGKAFKDHATDEKGDVLTFWALSKGIELKEAWKELKQLLEGNTPSIQPKPFRRQNKPQENKAIIHFSKLRIGNQKDFEQVAKLRELDPLAIKWASDLGVLRFGEVCRSSSWLLKDGIDDYLSIAEARRTDGKPYPAFKHLQERKAHCLKGSKKKFPVGLGVALREQEKHGYEPESIMLVEGSPDYLTAWHCLIRAKRKGILPLALLGGSNELHEEALKYLTGRNVRIYPHIDPSKAGEDAGKKWANQLHHIGCSVEHFDFSGLTKKDGSTVTDLNDAILVPDAQRHELKNLLP